MTHGKDRAGGGSSGGVCFRQHPSVTVVGLSTRLSHMLQTATRLALITPVAMPAFLADREGVGVARGWQLEQRAQEGS